MNRALHRQTRQRVYATGRNASRFAAYVCEECGVSVHFVRESTRYDGVIIPAHFSHEQNSARARHCSLFREGAERTDASVNRRPAVPRGRPELMLRVSMRNHWQLGLFLPRFEINADTLWLGEASPSLVPFDLANVGPGGGVTEVFPQAGDYSLELRKGNAPVRMETVSGLDTLALFVTSSSWGRRLGADEMLAWGKSYVLVAPQLPDSFLKKVGSRPLPRHRAGKFHAALFALPAKSDASVARAVTNTLGRDIVEQPIIASVIAPLNARLLPNGRWLLPAGATSCIVAFTFARPVACSGAVVLRSADEGISDECANYPAGTSRGCARFSSLAVGNYEVLFDYSDAGRIRFEVPQDGERLRQAPRPAVAFAVQNADHMFQHTLWERGLVDVLRRAEAGELTVDDVRVPEGATLRVEAVSREEEIRQSITFDESDPQSPVDTKQRQLAALLARVLSAHGAVSLDAGGFGRVDFHSEPRTVRPRVTSARSRWLDLVRHNLGIRHNRWDVAAGVMRRFQAHLRVEERM